MKDLYRDSSVLSSMDLSNTGQFWICRVLEGCALIRVESRDKLRTAKQSMQRIAAAVPGSYLIFNNRSKRVVERTVVGQTAV